MFCRFRCPRGESRLAAARPSGPLKRRSRLFLLLRLLHLLLFASSPSYLSRLFSSAFLLLPLATGKEGPILRRLLRGIRPTLLPSSLWGCHPFVAGCHPFVVVPSFGTRIGHRDASSYFFSMCSFSGVSSSSLSEAAALLQQSSLLVPESGTAMHHPSSFLLRRSGRTVPDRALPRASVVVLPHLLLCTPSSYLATISPHLEGWLHKSCRCHFLLTPLPRDGGPPAPPRPLRASVRCA